MYLFLLNHQSDLLHSVIVLDRGMRMYCIVLYCIAVVVVVVVVLVAGMFMQFFFSFFFFLPE